MKITADNYYSIEADKEYMSVSQFKDWLKCEHMAHAKYVTAEYKDDDKKCFLAGNYVHSMFEGFEAHKEFLEKNKDKLHSKRKPFGLLKEYSDLDNLYNCVKGDEGFMFYLDGEKEKYYTAELFGVMWKMKVDVINHQYKFITDLKTCKNFELSWNNETRKQEMFYELHNYYLQAAIYQAIIKIITGEKYEMYIAAITKEKSPDHELYEFKSENAQNEFYKQLQIAQDYLPEIMSIKNGDLKPERCNRCDYCKMTKKITKAIII